VNSKINRLDKIRNELEKYSLNVFDRELLHFISTRSKLKPAVNSLPKATYELIDESTRPVCCKSYFRKD
jgi:chorismate mutase